jgi:glycosyltransferase involved in cell wall biosynthesis
VLIPTFNDWDSLVLLLPELDEALASRSLEADILVVDDGSTAEPTGELARRPFSALRRIDVLRLRRNLGHQRAIAVGLAYIEDCLQSRTVVVMDGDGEDDPSDVPRLLDQLERTGQDQIVFAERTRRSESRTFRFFYALYKLAHLLLTGQKVRVGNFSAIPHRRLTSLVVVAEVWNHYAAGVIRSRQPYCSIPTHRSQRLCGRSTMNFVSLVTHGLSAISVYSDVVGVRLLVLSMILAALAMGGIVASVIVRLMTAWAIPGWASSTVGLLLVLLGQAVMAAFVFSFMILGARHGSTFLPRRDYSFFVGSVWTLHGDGPSATPLPVPELAEAVPW